MCTLPLSSPKSEKLQLQWESSSLASSCSPHFPNVLHVVNAPVVTGGRISPYYVLFFEFFGPLSVQGFLNIFSEPVPKSGKGRTYQSD